MNLDEHAFDSLVTSEASAPLINIGGSQDQSIRELVELVAEVWASAAD